MQSMPRKKSQNASGNTTAKKKEAAKMGGQRTVDAELKYFMESSFLQSTKFLLLFKEALLGFFSFEGLTHGFCKSHGLICRPSCLKAKKGQRPKTKLVKSKAQHPANHFASTNSTSQSSFYDANERGD